jgi:hypothetical protein
MPPTTKSSQSSLFFLEDLREVVKEEDLNPHMYKSVLPTTTSPPPPFKSSLYEMMGNP